MYRRVVSSRLSSVRHFVSSSARCEPRLLGVRVYELFAYRKSKVCELLKKILPGLCSIVFDRAFFCSDVFGSFILESVTDHGRTWICARMTARTPFVEQKKEKKVLLARRNPATLTMRARAVCCVDGWMGLICPRMAVGHWVGRAENSTQHTALVCWVYY